jgi:putative oxidoreductase
MTFLQPFTPHLLSVLRIMIGLLLLQHGTAKYLGFPELAYFKGLSIATPVGISGILELVGGPLLILGLFTRPTAFVLSGLCAVAYFYAYASKSFFPLVNGGEAAILYCFALLYIAAAGGGPLSLDRILRRAD